MTTNTQKNEHFIEWEQKVFGAGYGTGELPILTAVKTFCNSLEGERSYDYTNLQENLGDTVTWLLINAFDKANMIEWGASARHGWLTSSGVFVKDFVKGKTAAQLYEIVMSDHEPVCCCEGEIKEHTDCGKNPMINEKYADELIYKQND